jgi:hypothetical protein
MQGCINGFDIVDSRHDLTPLSIAVKQPKSEPFAPFQNPAYDRYRWRKV